MPLNIVKDANEFHPHMAVCSMTINDGSANKHNLPVIQKSKIKSDKEIALLKMLKSDTPEVLAKASVSNDRRMLEAVLKDKFASAETYTWIWLRDFDPETQKAVFEMDDKSYAIGYSKADNGLIELAEDMEEVIHHDVYTTASENSLILKGNALEEQKDSENDSEEQEIEEEGISPASEDNPENNDNEDDMSDKKDAPVEFTKAQQDQIAELLKAERLAVQQEIEAAALLKSTTEALEAQEFVAQEDVETFAKGLVANQELATIVLKSLNSAKEALTAKDEEIAEIKKEFATQEQVTEEAEVVIEKGNVTETLAAQMAKLKNK